MSDALENAKPFHAHPFDDDKLREECGVFGVIGVADAANFVALGLHALQHLSLIHISEPTRLESKSRIPASA